MGLNGPVLAVGLQIHHVGIQSIAGIERIGRTLLSHHAVGQHHDFVRPGYGCLLYTSHALCTFIELYANQTVSPVMFHKVSSRRRRYEALPIGCPR